MAGYRKRLEQDLDRWIAAGLVGPDKRAAILASVPEGSPPSAAAALGFVGAVLLGAAVIAFTAANWDGMSRMARFVILLAAFTAACAAGAWFANRKDPLKADGLLTLAALIFAAAIGLTGQIFDIAGDPKAALYGAALAAGGLSLAGRSTGAAVAALLFCGIADYNPGLELGPIPDNPIFAYVSPAALAAAVFAWRWNSAVLAHAAAAATLAGLFWITGHSDDPWTALYGCTVMLAILAAAARVARARDLNHAGVYLGWAAGGALAAFAAAGLFTSEGLPVWLHRGLWLGGAVGLLALGRHDRHGGLTTLGVLGLISAIVAIMMDLGLDLMAGAALFGAMALAALLAARVLQRKARP